MMDIDQPDQQQTTVALNRRQLADAGQQQLLLLLQTSKALLDAYSNLQPTTESQSKLQQLQQSYLQVSQDVHQTLQQCQALEQQEAAVAAATSAAGEAQTSEQQQHIQQLEARAADLRQQLQRQNQLIKQVIDKLRHLVDAFNMWDSHERHLVQQSVPFAMQGIGQI